MSVKSVFITANDKRFNKLPPEIQKIIKEVALEYERVAARDLNNRQAKGLENLNNSGATVRTLSDDVRLTWARSLSGFPNDMAKEANSRDLPGTEILQSYIEMIEQDGYDWPVRYEIGE